MLKGNYAYRVSVVVPAYNAEMYLKKCLDSLIQQTYEDMEIILVDDGSSDRTGEICDWYQRQYPSLIWAEHRSSNGGVSRARLQGLRKASGTHIAFVDADDWIERDYLSSMMKELGEADMVAAGISRDQFQEEENVICEYNSLPAGTYASDSERSYLYSRMLYEKAPYQFGILPYMCNKIFKKEQIYPLLERVDKRIFDGEDVAVIYPYLLEAKEIVLTDQCKYHYVSHTGSMSLTDFKEAYLSLSCLYQALYSCFADSSYCESLMTQLDHYMRRMVWKKDPAAYLMANSYYFPYRKIKSGSQIILYGMGKVGNAFYRQIKQTQYCEIAAWADREPEKLSHVSTEIAGIRPSQIKEYSYDYVVIAIQNKRVAGEIGEQLQAGGVEKGKIVRPDF